MNNEKQTSEAKETLLLEAVEAFKKRFKKVIDETLSECYTDILPFVLDDTEHNAQMIAERALRSWLNGQPEMMEGVTLTPPWNTTYVARKLYEVNKDQIENAIIKAQEEKIEQLKFEMKIVYERMR